jgi:hypothetical protein
MAEETPCKNNSDQIDKIAGNETQTNASGFEK